MNPEPPWRIVASITTSGVARAIGLTRWWWTVPGPWELATFQPIPNRPIRPMGLVAGLVIGAIGGGFIRAPLSALVLRLSERPAVQTAAALGACAAAMPMLNFLLFWVIIFGRGIELGS